MSAFRSGLLGVLEGVDYVKQGFREGEEKQRRNTLAQLSGDYYAAPSQNGLAKIAYAGGDPSQLANYGQEQERRERELATQHAMLLSRMDPAQRPQAWPSVRQRLVAGGIDPQFLPEQYDERIDGMVQSLAGAEAPKPYNVPSGGALVGADGKVIFQNPTAPKAPSYVNVPDGQGGTVLMMSTPEGLVPPSFGGPQSSAPQAPPPGYGSPVGDFLTDATQVASLHGFDVTSGLRSPEENAALPGAAPRSAHMSGNGIDLSVRGKTQEQIAAITRDMNARGYVGGYTTRGTAPHLHFEKRGGAPGGAPSGPRMGYNPPKQGGDESFGQPVPVTDPATGKVVMVQFGNRGGQRIVSNYNPGPTQRDSKPPTEGERNAAGYFSRMDAAERELQAVEAAGYEPGGYYDKLTAGNGLLNYFAGDEAQQYRQKQEDWVRAKLRKESGAVIGDEEMEREIKTYFPQPGDTEKTIANKAESRRIAIEAMRKSGGRAIEAPMTDGDDIESLLELYR